jgi:hypothetical protein
MRDLKINVFEVMDPGPAYNNAFRGHLPLSKLQPVWRTPGPSQTGSEAVVNLSIIRGTDDQGGKIKKEIGWACDITLASERYFHPLLLRPENDDQNGNRLFGGNSREAR